MESKRERNENNNVEINIDSFPKHFRKRQQSSNKKHTANFDHLLQNRNASIDLQQSLIPALQSIYKIPEENQFILLQPLLSMYIQNKYFGELMNKSRSVLIEDVENVDQIDFSSTNIGYSSTHSSPSPSSLTSQAPQDQPLDLSINKTKRSQNDIYHSLSDVLNLSNNYHNNDVVPTKSKSKRSRFKSPSIPTPKSTEHLNNYHIPTNSSSENDSDFHTSMQAFVKQEFPLFSCHICGQGFGIQDRLAKHVASCHKTRKKQSDTTKTYECEVCKRSFARSDMLTRHSRLHTGVKPYTCNVCGQVFSRSDHLSTHQRTHTGEKPYRCPFSFCQYAACRRDMINRHMRTHTRQDSTKTNTEAVPTISPNTMNNNNIPLSTEKKNKIDDSIMHIKTEV